MTTSKSTVLVTGASGFVATHCIVQLLRAGYRVRGTLRSAARGASLRSVLRRELGADGALIDKLELCEAELTLDADWREAVRSCDHVLHIASPVPTTPPKNPAEVILPARDGTLRVLRAAEAEGVRRVVMTSSIAAVLYGHARDGSRTYDERDWSVLSTETGPYEQSKTQAERAAWDYVESLAPERRFELVTLQPGVVLGPVMDDDYAVSVEVVRKLLAREAPGCPNLGWALTDVRDLAAAHLSALRVPEARGQRFIVASHHVTLREIAAVLARRFAARGFKVPSTSVPDWVLKVVGYWDRTAALAVPELGKRQDVSSAQARAVLSFRPRDIEDTLVDTAESLIQHQLIRPSRSRSKKPHSEATAVAQSSAGDNTMLT
jgi:dihydroflavonol-4-reductase